jgi:hypothetical protein
MKRTKGRRLMVSALGVAGVFAVIGGAALAGVVTKPSTTHAGETQTSTTAQTSASAGKVTICHKGKVTLSVSVNALAAHQRRHGDSLGACSAAGHGKPAKARKHDKGADDSAGADKDHDDDMKKD